VCKVRIIYCSIFIYDMRYYIFSVLSCILTFIPILLLFLKEDYLHFGPRFSFYTLAINTWFKYAILLVFILCSTFLDALSNNCAIPWFEKKIFESKCENIGGTQKHWIKYAIDFFFVRLIHFSKGLRWIFSIIIVIAQLDVALFLILCREIFNCILHRQQPGEGCTEDIDYRFFMPF